MTLWGGRFTEPSDSQLKALNDSIAFDRRLYAEDIQGSMAYARALAAAGVITSQEAEQLVAGLERVHAEFEAGTFTLLPDDEDIHTAVERRLTELVGAVGGKLHTGRSRNDQVATDFRLWSRRAAVQISRLIAELQSALLSKASEHVDTLMPGYTHLQPAQPITAGHWLMSYFWMLARDRERLTESMRRLNVSPLGAGALAGTAFDIDVEALAHGLGFSSHSQNSLDAVSDRDFVAELLFILALLNVHLSRFGEDMIIYSNPLFGFITLDDRYSTGSSLMPQKRNPDPMELARGKAGRLIGNLAGFLATLKGLPSTYNKDLQEDKEALFDSVDIIVNILPVVTAIVSTLNMNAERMAGALDADMLATDLADYLVRKGVPFRQAHHLSGKAVRLAAEKHKPLTDLTFDEFQSISDLFATDVFTILDFGYSVSRRRGSSGTAQEAVKRQIAAAQAWMDAHSA